MSAASYELPSLPFVPPIKLSEEPSAFHSHASISGSVPIENSPALSFADSSSTTLTSSSKVHHNQKAFIRDPSNLAPPQGLRKSISVDSFVPVGWEITTKSHHINRANANEVQDVSRGGRYPPPTIGFKTERDQTRYIGRNRGESISSVKEDDEFDDERYDPSESSLSPKVLKGRFSQAPVVRSESVRITASAAPGNLPLPSRAPALVTTSSVSSVETTSTTATANDALHITRSSEEYLSSLNISGRLRSESLGVIPSSTGRRMYINTHLLSRESHEDDRLVTIAVVGMPRVGKTKVIQHGFGPYAVSRMMPLPFDATQLPGRPSYPRYFRREGRIPDEDVTLHVIKVDIPATDPDTTYTVPWPKGLPPADGIIICYDSSDPKTFDPVGPLLKGYKHSKKPIMVLACKADLPPAVNFDVADRLVKRYDVGIVLASKTTEEGKEKLRNSVIFLLRSCYRRPSPKSGKNYRNPASPDILVKPSNFESSRTVTPIATVATSHFLAIDEPLTRVQTSHHSGPVTANYHTPFDFSSSYTSSPDPPTPPALMTSPLPDSTSSKNTPFPFPALPSTALSEPSKVPKPPARAYSTGDLLYESASFEAKNPQGPDNERVVVRVNNTPHEEENRSVVDAHNVLNVTVGVQAPDAGIRETSVFRPGGAQWATLDELLDKLLFLAISGDDPTFITSFLLTYRRFATPRSVLLAMQKRMRQLDNPCGDPMFACFAQMRICNLLETWIREYEHDFAVKGTTGALNALIRSIISKTHLLHYGSEFLPFLEVLPTLVDEDTAWALDPKKYESDDPDTEDDYDEYRIEPDAPLRSELIQTTPILQVAAPTRERGPSIPLARSLLTSAMNGSTLPESPTRQLIRDLVKLSQEVEKLDSDTIAQEITRLEVAMFLKIEPRHWLNFTLVSGKKDEKEPVTAFNTVSNHLADWVVSLILCHDRPRHRARQIEKFVEVAQRLRTLNNYSALRAFVAGINSATFPGDETMEQFKQRSPEHAKNLQSWDVLLQQMRAHRSYRMALRNSKGACIPALEVHMSDLLKAHEGNSDSHPSEPDKINWGKYNMLARFVTTISQCQAQCRNTKDYNFTERTVIKDLIGRPVMNFHQQRLRMPHDYEDRDISRGIDETPAHPTLLW